MECLTDLTTCTNHVLFHSYNQKRYCPNHQSNALWSAILLTDLLFLQVRTEAIELVFKFHKRRSMGEYIEKYATTNLEYMKPHMSKITALFLVSQVFLIIKVN